MSKPLSDWNSPDTAIGSNPSNVSMGRVYSDISSTFLIHPVLNDIRPVYDLEAVKNSIRNLVLTAHHEKPFHPEIGTAIASLLFENADSFTASSIRQEVIYLLSNYEPRVTDLSVSVYDQSEQNAYIVTVGFAVTFRANFTSEVSITLNRLR